eukprot:CAMPEP_0117583342 /NCGR_PEP_ID=MMETSP0784-20121206/66959_1 /TAXON_ID=39447 /ORGANISM="" /LENGTH=365 /DNA_ID=CAMNT_0005384013 /DNA_START=35 /DNA_END=1130 /DNA_ORIENTATION=+
MVCLADIFAAIDTSSCSNSERKFLRRRAIECAAQASQNGEHLLVQYERLLAEASRAAGAPLSSAPAIQKRLVQAGHRALARRIERLARLRHGFAHPDSSLVIDVFEDLACYQPDTSSTACSPSDDDISCPSSSVGAPLCIYLIERDTQVAFDLYGDVLCNASIGCQSDLSTVAWQDVVCTGDPEVLISAAVTSALCTLDRNVRLRLDELNDPLLIGLAVDPRPTNLALANSSHGGDLCLVDDAQSACRHFRALVNAAHFIEHGPSQSRGHMAMAVLPFDDAHLRWVFVKVPVDTSLDDVCREFECVIERHSSRPVFFQAIIGSAVAASSDACVRDIADSVVSELLLPYVDSDHDALQRVGAHLTA